MDKNERIEQKRKELAGVFRGLSSSQMRIAHDLIEQAGFLAVELEDLSEQISIEGATEEYTNGAHQSGRKVSSNAKVYSSLIGKYTAIITKLLRLAPDDRARFPMREHPETSYFRTIAEELSPRETETDTKDLHKKWIYETEFRDAVKAGEFEEDDFEEFYSDFCKRNGIEKDS